MESGFQIYAIGLKANETLETTEFCAWVLSLSFSLLMAPPSVSHLVRRTIMAPRWISTNRFRMLGAAALALALAALLLFVRTTTPAPAPTFEFLGYTNRAGQTEALFRLDHPPRPSLADGLYELRYLTPTGWARPTANFSFDFFGWDGTGSIAAISVETTNLPARVVMDLWTPLRGPLGLYDLLLDRWDKFKGANPVMRGRVTYVTNQTSMMP
jgi:hypothetical protein